MSICRYTALQGPDRQGFPGAGSLGDVSSFLVHEAMHALHYQRYPQMRRSMQWVHDYDHLYRAATGTGAQRSQARDALIALLFTEFWAYCRQHEYHNIPFGAATSPLRQARSEITRYLFLLQTNFRQRFDPQVSANFTTAASQGLRPLARH